MVRGLVEVGFDETADLNEDCLERLLDPVGFVEETFDETGRAPATKVSCDN